MTFQCRSSIRWTIIINPCSNTKNLAASRFLGCWVLNFFFFSFSCLLSFLALFLILPSYPSNSRRLAVLYIDIIHCSFPTCMGGYLPFI